MLSVEKRVGKEREDVVHGDGCVDKYYILFGHLIDVEMKYYLYFLNWRDEEK